MIHKTIVVDEECKDLLDRCISEFKKYYEVPEIKVSYNIMIKKLSKRYLDIK